MTDEMKSREAMQLPFEYRPPMWSTKSKEREYEYGLRVGVENYYQGDVIGALSDWHAEPN